LKLRDPPSGPDQKGITLQRQAFSGARFQNPHPVADSELRLVVGDRLIRDLRIQL
jgi:hypothetical protein